MRLKHNVALILVAVALLASAYGVYRTGTQPAPPSSRTARRAPSDRTIVVDQRSLVTAEQLARLPVTAEERPFAEDALRIADGEMDLAFAQAVRRTANLPRANTAETKEADARLQQALRALTADQAQVTALTAALAKASPAAAESLDDRLNLAKAQAALDQDEADDARQDLRRAGGDPQGRMEDLIAEHDAASKSSDSVRVVVTNPVAVRGLIRQVLALQALYQKEALVSRARDEADSLAARFKDRHDSVEARAVARTRDSATTRLTHDSAASLLAAAKRRALDGKIRSTLDQRVDNQHQLSNAYAGWIAVLGAQERSALNRALRGLALILGIALVAMLLTRWIDHLLGEKVKDSRRTQTLHMITRVTLQVIAVLLSLLVIFGPPDNLGTIVGLAGAGLTVALKDFILSFLGWFALMGRNGIRIGDLVEINGVTGEVVELGMFRTVLLETGDWTESGHPTGRRVTFTNSFAIEGHYFNFSTSGRWLWDDLRIIVPSGHDPYPIAEALRKQVEEATAEGVREAEVQWKQARRSPQVAVPQAGPSVSLKPIAGGFEIKVRYVTRVTEREDLRGKLYQTAVEMLGGAKVVAGAEGSPRDG
ncbi:MAG: mechanosensitive ion channel domain-containing protein [Gemmatimonadales bacterium]